MASPVIILLLDYSMYLAFCSVELQSEDTTTNDHSSDTELVATSEYDSSKPPAYDDALTYCKTVSPDNDVEGYPEPSLVDVPPPPSYDSVN